MAKDARSRVTAIVLAAGKGRRLRAARSKPLIEIRGTPIVLYSLRVLEQSPEVRDVILVVNRQNQNKIRALAAQAGINKISRIVLGGMRRQDSVARGLAVLPEKSGIVLIHDAARPFIDRSMVVRLLRAVRATGAAILGVPVTSTIKEIKRSPGHQVARSPVIKKTIDRKDLWEVQTPQAFRAELILAAYQRFGRADATDDAALVERLKHPVAAVFGSYANIKITTPEDLFLARVIAGQQGKKSRK